MDGVDEVSDSTQTVVTTRAPAVLKKIEYAKTKVALLDNMVKAKTFLRLHLKENYTCFLREDLQCMKCYLPKKKYLVQYIFGISIIIMERKKTLSKRKQ